MILKSILWFLIILCIHKLFRFIRALLNWKNYVIFNRPRTSSTPSSRPILRFPVGELGSLIALLAFLIHLVFGLCYGPPASYFGLTHTPVDAQAFIIRNRFKEYVNYRERTEPSFATMLRERRQHVLDDELVEESLRSSLYSSQPDIEREYLRLEELSQLLRLNERRRLYIQFGPEAALSKCQICESGANTPSQSNFTWQYALLKVPTMLLPYGIALLLVGWATRYPRKARWRTPVVFISVIAISYEVFELLMGFGESLGVYLYTFGNIPSPLFLTRWEQLEIVRNMLLTLLSAMVLLIDLPLAVDKLKIVLNEVKEGVEMTMVKLQIARLAHMSIISDDALRRHYRQHEKEITPMNSLFTNPRYQQLINRLARKHDMEKIVEESQNAINQLFAEQESE